MATYNWSIRPNVQNPYSAFIGVINDTPEDVKPSNACYVALFGNDTTGNGSRMYPYKTIRKGNEIAGGGNLVILGSGVYREDLPGSSRLVADGDVRLENIFFGMDNGTQFYGVKLDSVYGFGYTGGFLIKNVFNTLGFQIGGQNVYGNIFNVKGAGISVRLTNYSMNYNGQNTFINSVIGFSDGGEEPTGKIYGMCANSIFSNCKILLTENVTTDYSVFHNCEFTFDGVTFETFASINEFLNRLYAIYPNNNGFKNCYFGDPKFNNPEIGDYSLAFDSPAKNTSYFGTYVGAKSVGYPIKVTATEVDGGFDFSTNVNLTVADNSLTVTNPEMDASIESKVISNINGRELAEAPIFGFNADRNGQYIDSIPDLSDTTVAVGTNLKDLTPYLVEVAAVIIDGAVIQPGERFTTKNVLAFSSEGGGVCREILEAPQRHTIMARFSNGGASKSAGDALVAGNWYYPIAGTINYNGIDYTEKAFKAIDANSFTTPDGGILIEAFTNEAYQHYEPGIAFTSNNIGNVRTREILRGNGDPDYVRGVGFEFPINARFIQLKYIIRVKNLKP